MAYGDLNYTTEEINADLEKVHDKLAVVEEAPSDGKQYGRKDGAWEEVEASTQYLDLSMFTGDSGTLSEEDYQKVVKAYNNKIGIVSSGQYYGDLYISERSGIYVIIVNIPTSEGMDTLCGVRAGGLRRISIQLVAFPEKDVEKGTLEDK